MATLIIGLIVLGVFIAIVAGEVKRRRRGGGGCQGCPNAGLCRPEKK